ncbi:CBP3-like protein [Pleurostoma richardsiae]|uniref:CBP3-like protein n=1 Tax=Pleurostoma richardsiae TaxID=41990 RepID=A0AA38RQX3_9PEZI|nr:CBP3-like protein [Pleurostoma richardsiae]
MASRTCPSCRDILRQQARLIAELRPRPNVRLNRRGAAFEAAKGSRRLLHQTRRLQQDPESDPSLIRSVFSKFAGKTAHGYQVYGATEQIYKACAGQAPYTISEEDRKNETVPTTDEGEEIGVGGGMWHDAFKLPPTFSTWSQVTMLHMYLIVVRLRCLTKPEWHDWQNQLVNHFFNNAEERMDLVHGLSSRMIRQRYLRDLFTTWRGVIMAYDEGFIKGDAVLAAAVWRNVFKARDDVDLRMLAAIVSWMRLCLKNLDQMQDAALLYHAASVFKWPATSELLLVDQPAHELQGVLTKREPGGEAKVVANGGKKAVSVP